MSFTADGVVLQYAFYTFLENKVRNNQYVKNLFHIFNNKYCDSIIIIIIIIRSLCN